MSFAFIREGDTTSHGGAVLRAPTLYRLQQLSDALDCSVDQLLQRGSKRVDDQLATIADALLGLDANE
ncbi:hypothetical protein [Burkholderia gladioli]|nr:hypothetical protein [Burkholderia gladioli]